MSRPSPEPVAFAPARAISPSETATEGSSIATSATTRSRNRPAGERPTSIGSSKRARAASTTSVATTAKPTARPSPGPPMANPAIGGTTSGRDEEGERPSPELQRFELAHGSSRLPMGPSRLPGRRLRHAHDDRPHQRRRVARQVPAPRSRSMSKPAAARVLAVSRFGWHPAGDEAPRPREAILPASQAPTPPPRARARSAATGPPERGPGRSRRAPARGRSRCRGRASRPPRRRPRPGTGGARPAPRPPRPRPPEAGRAASRRRRRAAMNRSGSASTRLLTAPVRSGRGCGRSRLRPPEPLPRAWRDQVRAHARQPGVLEARGHAVVHAMRTGGGRSPGHHRRVGRPAHRVGRASEEGEGECRPTSCSPS